VPISIKKNSESGARVRYATFFNVGHSTNFVTILMYSDKFSDMMMM